MKNFPYRSLALVALLAACGDNDADYGAGAVKQGTKDATQATKEAAKDATQASKTAAKDAAQATEAAAKQAVNELKTATDGLERFANSLQEGIGDATYNVGQSIKSKMPEVENLVEKVKARLNAGDEDMRESAATLDEKLTDLRNKLAALGDDAAAATKEAKEDAADAFKSLMDNLQNGLEKLD